MSLRRTGAVTCKEVRQSRLHELPLSNEETDLLLSTQVTCQVENKVQVVAKVSSACTPTQPVSSRPLEIQQGRLSSRSSDPAAQTRRVTHVPVSYDDCYLVSSYTMSLIWSDTVRWTGRKEGRARDRRTDKLG